MMHCRTVATVSAASAGDPGRLGCELVTGHPGNHIAFVTAAQDGDQCGWLRWDAGSGELVQVDPCDAKLPQGRYSDDCLLPMSHPGPHSFDLPARDVGARDVDAGVSAETVKGSPRAGPIEVLGRTVGACGVRPRAVRLWSPGDLNP